MVCEGISAPRSDRKDSSRLDFWWEKYPALGMMPRVLLWTSSFCSSGGIQTTFWSQGTPMARAKSMGRSCSRLEIAFAFAPYFSQTGFSDWECSCQENDWFVDTDSYDRVCHTEWRHQTTWYPNRPRLSESTWSCTFSLLYAPRGSVIDWRWWTIAPICFLPCFFSFC